MKAYTIEELRRKVAFGAPYFKQVNSFLDWLEIQEQEEMKEEE